MAAALPLGNHRRRISLQAGRCFYSEKGTTIVIRGLLRIVPVLVAMIAALGFLPVNVANAQDERCFPETGFCISGPIRAYWERNGGLPVFGFPITGQAEEIVEGVVLKVQWFERDRLEIQPNGTVTAGRLGVELLEKRGTPWQQGSGAPAGQGCIAFPETGHQVCGAFATYWRNNGGLERFGFPITGEFTESNEGKALTVQYFERRRFELHGSTVLLGLLGREVRAQNTVTQPEQPAPDDRCAGIPEPQTAFIEPNCAPIGTIFLAIAGGFTPGEAIGIYITAPNKAVFGAPFQSVADDEGLSEIISFNTAGVPNNSSIDGIWAITFEGVDSKHVSIAYFKILR
jgi:hypothetical protein